MQKSGEKRYFSSKKPIGMTGWNFKLGKLTDQYAFMSDAFFLNQSRYTLDLISHSVYHLPHVAMCIHALPKGCNNS